MQNYCDEQLLKSKKEHYQHEIQRVISYFGQEYSVYDPLSIIGKRFKDKEVEFDTMRKENQELLLKTRNLADEIQKLRVSLNDSGVRFDEMHLSLDRAERYESITASKYMTKTLESHNQSIRSRLEGLDRALEQTRENYTDYAKEYDQLLECLFSYFSKEKTAKSLANEVQQPEKNQADDKEDMVLVPRKRYEKLIEIYSINIAEISINQLREKIKLTNASVNASSAINFIEENKRVYREKYSDIVRGQEIGTKDLHSLFKTLARKVGFERQWERYHVNSANEAVAFKAKIDSILSFKLAEVDAGKEEELAKRLREGELIAKIDKIVDFAGFDQEEKNLWTSVNAKINGDKLITIEKIVEKYEEIIQEQSKAIASQASKLINSTVTKSLQEFSKIIDSRLKTKKTNLAKGLKEIAVDSLKQAIEERSKSPKDIWQSCAQVYKEKIDQVFKKIGKGFIFLSSGSLYNSFGTKP